MSSRRRERVSGLLLEVVAETLLREVKDPRLQAITVTGVRMSPDLKTAKIFFTTRQEEERPEVLAGLRKATGFIKRQVASRLQLRYTPDLEFHYDETLEKVNRLESLLRQTAEKERESLD
jgi:ribosome-binding factor A